MAHTDMTDPFWVRLGLTRQEYEDEYSFFDVSPSFKWTNAERGIGPKEARWSKRMRSKKNRRRAVPHWSMRGYGWGEENLRRPNR